MEAHRLGCSKPHARCHLLNALSSRLEQTLRLQHALAREPGVRRRSDLRPKAAQERARRDCRHRSKIVHADRLSEPSGRPLEGLGDAAARVARDGLIDELRLSSIAVRRNHESSRHLIRDFGAVVQAHEMKAEIDSRSAPRRREDAPVIHMEHVGLDPDPRVRFAKNVRIAPVGGSASSVQKPRRGKDKRS